ncbi:MAG: DMT family transporter [Planctomycetota bacterium]
MQDSSGPLVGPGQGIGSAELAALGASMVWAVSSLLFAFASRRLGPFRTNGLRILLASLVLVAAHAAWHRTPLPAGLTGRHLALIVSSGLVGLALGDFFYFHSISVLGARVGSLLMATAPMQAAALGFVALDERAGPRALAGIVAVSLGVVVVVLDRRAVGALPAEPGQRRLAVLSGLLGGLGQAGGLVLARAAFRLETTTGGRPDPLSVTMLRMLAALAFVLPWSLVAMRRRRAPTGPRAQAVQALGFAVLLGPTTGVFLSMVAVVDQEAGVAAALLALAPVLVIPIAWLAHGERPGLAGFVGTFVATAGTVLLVTR